MPLVTVERPLKEKLGDEAVDAPVRLINQSRTEQKNNVIEFVEEKFERRLSEEIAGVSMNIAEVEKRFDHRLSEEISGVNQNLAEVEKRFDHRLSELDTKIASTRADLIRWMFIFWVGQVGFILGMLSAFFK
jgi:hypothetical protein